MCSEYVERRTHPRFPLRAYASVKTVDRQWNAHLLDISLSGARLAVLDEPGLQIGDSLVLLLELEDLSNSLPGESLELAGCVVHSREHLIGITFTSMHQDQEQLLKRLVSGFAQS